ncbi:MAG: hypothetical protein LBN29_05995 [Mediterranea sp.]|jgi:YD repeat-containing protein|nr:hypothetical protein [Mediterranea sp.]
MKKTVLLSLMAAAPSPRASRGPHRTFRLTLAALFLAISSPAQIPGPPVNLQSPNVASLGLYGDIPVSLFTGTPSIEIPLYTIEECGFQIPLSLTYHSAGIRPDQHPGWVGLGWTLQAGGAIYREVKDMCDEFNIPEIAYGERNGFYFNRSVLDTPLWNDADYLREIAENDLTQVRDTDPDEFSFSFLGYTGKFYMDHAGNWQAQCDRPVRIEFDGIFREAPFPTDGTRAFEYGGYPKTFNSFTIVGEDGTRYVFGGTDSSIEYSINFFDQVEDYWLASAWHLTKIIPTRGAEIVFSYERGSYINQMYLSIFNLLRSSFIEEEALPGIDIDCGSSQNTFTLRTHYNGKLLSPVYLTRIESSICDLAFSRSETTELRYPISIYLWRHQQWSDNPFSSCFLHFLEEESGLGFPECLDDLRWAKLDKITVSSKTGESRREFRFGYNNNPSQRLTLTSMTEVGIGKYPVSNSERAYLLEYNQPEALPGYLFNQVDHWGFYNGNALDEYYLIPQYIIEGKPYDEILANALNYPPIFYTRRNPSAAHLQYGILKKITYPTGGYTRLEFEPHSCRKEVKAQRWDGCETLDANKLVGGLRIKRIIQSPTGRSGDEAVDKEYFYVNDYLSNRENPRVSSGVLGGKVEYGFANYKTYIPDPDAELTLTAFSSQSVLPACVNAQGSHIGYSEVVERHPDGSFIRYQFSNFDNGHLDDSPDATVQESHTPYEPYTSREVERGKQILKEHYSSDGLKKKSWRTTYERSSNAYIRSMRAWCGPVCVESPILYLEGSSYRTYLYSYRPKEEIEYVYENNLSTPMSITKSYTYNPYGLVRTVSQTVNGGTETVLYKRPDEFTTRDCQLLYATGALSPVVEEIRMFVPSSGGNTQVLQKTRSDYFVSLPPEGVRYLKATVRDSLPSLGWKTKYACTYYDEYGNPLTVNVNGMQTAYIWSYAGQYPIAEIQMGDSDYTFQDIVRAAMLTTSLNGLSDITRSIVPNEISLQSGSFQRGMRKALVKTYTHDPFAGITSITTTDGTTTYYEYDPLGRLYGVYILKGNVKSYLDEYRYNYAGPAPDGN